MDSVQILSKYVQDIVDNPLLMAFMALALVILCSYFSPTLMTNPLRKYASIGCVFAGIVFAAGSAMGISWREVFGLLRFWFDSIVDDPILSVYFALAIAIPFGLYAGGYMTIRRALFVSIGFIMGSIVLLTLYITILFGLIVYSAGDSMRHWMPEERIGEQF